MIIKKRETNIWHGVYRGVNFEINNFKTPIYDSEDKQDNWTYYLYIQLNKIPEENKPNSFWLKGKADDKGRVYYKYYKHHVITNIDLAGGCTWYSKEAGFDGENKVIKIGCDYQHYWDEGYTYDLEYIKSDVKNSIGKFLEFIPNYKYWCRGNGSLYNLDEGTLVDESFTSNEWKQTLKNLK